jgi:hypothetical protein
MTVAMAPREAFVEAQAHAPILEDPLLKEGGRPARWRGEVVGGQIGKRRLPHGDREAELQKVETRAEGGFMETDCGEVRQRGGKV